MSPEFREVVVASGAVIGMANALNRRAGESIFPTMDRDALASWFLTQLRGARRMSEVSDLAAIRLPELDAEMVEIVEIDNPASIAVADRTLVVDYSDEAPRVIWEIVDNEDLSWQTLPDGGVRLPGGRSVEVIVRANRWNERARGTDVPEIKEAVRAVLNQAVWQNWRQPQIDAPSDGEPVPLLEQEYGTCAVTGDALVAFGTFRVTVYYEDRDPNWYVEWYQTRKEADDVRSASQAVLDSLRPKREAIAVRNLALEVTGRPGWYDLPEDLRNRVSALGREYFYGGDWTPDRFTAWTADAKALVVEAEREIPLATERKARAEEEAKKEILIILPVVGGDEARAGSILAFAKEVERAVGVAAGARILRAEFEAPYGKDRRKDAVVRAVPGLDQTKGGGWFLSLSKADAVNVWLEGAMVWLESKTRPAAKSSTTSGGGLSLGGLFGGAATVRDARRR